MKNISLAIPYLYLLHVMVISIRVGATLLFAPIWGYPGLPHSLRILIVFSVSIGVSAVTPFSPQAYSNPALIMPTEFLVGMLLAMGIRIAFAGLHMGGFMVGFHLGFSSAQAIDPQTQNRSTVMSGFFTMVGFMLLLASNQHHVMFRALADSYVTFPVGVTINASQWFETLIDASKQIFIIGWRIALPVFLVTFILELTIGVISRVQPQFNTMVVTGPLKILVGLVVLGGSLAFLPRVLGNIVETMVLRK